MIQTGLILWILYDLNAPTAVIAVGWMVMFVKVLCCAMDLLDLGRE